MLRSMTGFASQSRIITVDHDEKVQISVALKSLNSRFFETTFKMPHIISSLEIPIIKKLKNMLYRGHVYCIINMSNTAPFKGEIKPAMSVCKGYANAIATIQKEIPLSGSLSVSDIMQTSNAFLVEEKELDSDTQKTLFSLIDNAIAILIKEQEKEGAALDHDIQNRIETISKEMKSISQRSSKQITEQKEKIAHELAQLEAGQEDASEIKKNSLYMVLDKIDIHEEIVRFETHVKNIQTILHSQTIENGKRIDFTLQELSREINTIAAKASDATIGSLAVNIKVELEKAREQTQNIV